MKHKHSNGSLSLVVDVCCFFCCLLLLQYLYLVDIAQRYWKGTERFD
jgi:hypothetical protein